tara:strand:+ start:615 stop:842 length:228 start_codon:yes stop_codon:yes gene_type:complete
LDAASHLDPWLFMVDGLRSDWTVAARLPFLAVHMLSAEALLRSCAMGLTRPMDTGVELNTMPRMWRWASGWSMLP